MTELCPIVSQWKDSFLYFSFVECLHVQMRTFSFFSFKYEDSLGRRLTASGKQKVWVLCKPSKFNARLKEAERPSLYPFPPVSDLSRHLREVEFTKKLHQKTNLKL
jgi:hypothetical protein